MDWEICWAIQKSHCRCILADIYEKKNGNHMSIQKRSKNSEGPHKQHKDVCMVTFWLKLALHLVITVCIMNLGNVLV